MPLSHQLYYAEFNGGIGQNPVILIHGAGSSRLCWPANLRRFPGSHVITLDLPGHGHSSDIPGEQSIQAYANCVVDFLRQKGYYKIILVGYSMGGAIALLVAHQNPNMVTGLGLIACGVHFNISSDLLEQLKVPSTADKAFRNFIKNSFSPKTPRAFIDKILRLTEPIRPGVLYGDWLACANFNFSSPLHEITTPSWVAVGTDDQMTPSSSAHYLAENLPNAQLQIIPSAAHLVVQEQPDALSLGLKKLIDRIDAQKN